MDGVESKDEIHCISDLKVRKMWLYYFLVGTRKQPLLSGSHLLLNDGFSHLEKDLSIIALMIER
jgi:hypothetical protein